jgi:hypothetical protein
MNHNISNNKSAGATVQNSTAKSSRKGVIDLDFYGCGCGLWL